MKNYCNIRDSYKEYKKEKVEKIKVEYKEDKEEIRKRKSTLIPLSVYLDIAYGFMKYIMKKLFEGNLVVLPKKFGKMEVIGRKVKIRFGEDGEPVGLAPDWKATKEYWEKNPKAKEKGVKIYHENPHTSGVRYRFRWMKEGIFIKNVILYSFRFTRGNRSILSNLIKGGKQYIIVS